MVAKVIELVKAERSNERLEREEAQMELDDDNDDSELELAPIGLD